MAYKNMGGGFKMRDILTKKRGLIYESDLSARIISLFPIARKGTEVEDIYQGTDLVISSGKTSIRIDITLNSFKDNVRWIGSATLGGTPHKIGIRSQNTWTRFQEWVFVICPTINNELDRTVDNITEDDIYDLIDILCDLREVNHVSS